MVRFLAQAGTGVRPNITLAERSSVKELAATKNVTVTRSDKGGETVIMPTSTLHELNIEHLSDTSTYKKLAKDPTPTLRLTINKTLENSLERCGFSKSIIHRLTTPPSASTQRFYTLPKTHKVNLKIGPIVPGGNGIFERLSWFLQIILKPLLRQVKAHVRNTEELLNRFHNCPSSALEEQIPGSLDVVSLYTYMDIEEVISTALQFSQKYNIHLYGLSSQDLSELLHLLLENNIFEYPGHGVFQQIRGLAMGTRLSGTLAILAMDRFTAILFWTYPDELTNDPSFRVNQK